LLESARGVAAALGDARIATLCLQHGVAELWTNDRDFARFRGLKIVNPLVEA
jgi:predicted nucleic acid-binding protein